MISTLFWTAVVIALLVWLRVIVVDTGRVREIVEWLKNLFKKA